MARKNSSLRMTWAAVIWAVLVIIPFSALSQSKPLKQIYVGVSSVSMGNIIIYVTKEAKPSRSMVSMPIPWLCGVPGNPRRR